MFNSEWWTTWGGDEEEGPNSIPKSSGLYSTRAPHLRDSSPEEEIPEDLEKAVRDLREELAYKDKKIADLLAEECPRCAHADRPSTPTNATSRCPRCMNADHPSTATNSTFGEDSAQSPGERSEFKGVGLPRGPNSTDTINHTERIFQWMSKCPEGQPIEIGGQHVNSNDRDRLAFQSSHFTTTHTTLSNVWKRMGLEETDPWVSVKCNMIRRSIYQWMELQQPRWLSETKINRKAIDYIVNQIACTSEFSAISADNRSIGLMVNYLRQQYRRNARRRDKKSARARRG